MLTPAAVPACPSAKASPNALATVASHLSSVCGVNSSSGQVNSRVMAAPVGRAAKESGARVSTPTSTRRRGGRRVCVCVCVVKGGCIVGWLPWLPSPAFKLAVKGSHRREPRLQQLYKSPSPDASVEISIQQEDEVSGSIPIPVLLDRVQLLQNRHASIARCIRVPRHDSLRPYK